MVAPSPQTCIDARHLERSSIPKDLHQFFNVAFELRGTNFVETNKEIKLVGTKYMVKMIKYGTYLP